MNVVRWWLDLLGRTEKPERAEPEEWLPDDPLLAGD
jgi:hypothetical protein